MVNTPADIASKHANHDAKREQRGKSDCCDGLAVLQQWDKSRDINRRDWYFSVLDFRRVYVMVPAMGLVDEE